MTKVFKKVKYNQKRQIYGKEKGKKEKEFLLLITIQREEGMKEGLNEEADKNQESLPGFLYLVGLVEEP